MKQFVRAILFIMLLTFGSSVGAGQRGSVANTQTDSPKVDKSDWPCAMLMHMPGFGPSDDYGVIVAVWSDGTMLFSGSPCNPDKNMLVGQADKSDVKAMMDAMVKAGFFKSKLKNETVIDSSYDVIGLAVKAKRTLSFHGSLNPSFGDNLNANADYRDFAKIFRRCEAELLAMSPNHVDVLKDRVGADGTFRGYDSADPTKTPWLHQDAWR